MKICKKSIFLLLAMFMIATLFSNIQTDAKEISIATPKVTVKLVNKKSGVKITIGKTKDAEGYEVLVNGEPASPEYCDLFHLKDSDGNVYLSSGIDLSTMIEKNGKKKRSTTLKNLQPGTYTVRVRSWNNKKFGTEVYSDWSKEESWTIKEAATNGYSNSYDFSKVKKGDVVKFGAYEQDLNYTNGKEVIEWIVLKKTKNSVLLLSKYALDRLPYNKYSESSITWEICSLRKWLNSDFINSAFNKTEQAMIKSTTIENYDNAIYKTPGGNDTKDKVFLMSQIDMINTEFGFSEEYNIGDVNRRCAMAWYKNKKGSGDYQTADGEESCQWWLRTPADCDREVCYVSDTGYVSSGGITVDAISAFDNDYAAVRPALYIGLKS